MRFLITVLLIAAATPSAAMCNRAYDGRALVSKLANAPDQARITLRQDEQPITFRWGQIRVFTDAIDKLKGAAGINPNVILCGDAEPNAFASNTEKGDVVAITLGMIQFADGDADIAAYVVGHELGHHMKHHMSDGQLRNGVINVLGLIAGVALGKRMADKGYDPSFALDLADVGSQLFSAKFDRDQEREADLVGLNLMVNAGYNPKGAIRASDRFIERRLGGDGTFFDNHPSWDDRTNIFTNFINTNPLARRIAASGDYSSPAANQFSSNMSNVQPAVEAAQMAHLRAALSAIKAGNKTLARTEVEQAAPSGNPQALTLLAGFKMDGIGGEVDKGGAIELYEKAAKAGSGYANWQLGLIYLNGNGVLADPFTAHRLFAEGVKVKSAGARIELAKSFAKGVAVKKDLNQARALIDEGVANNEPDAKFTKIDSLLNGQNGYFKDGQTAINLLKELASQNDMRALGMLGNVYFEGVDGIEPNYPEALTIFRRLQEMGVSFASYNLGYATEKGLGTAINLKFAKGFYELAATKGFIPAKIALGRLKWTEIRSGRISTPDASKPVDQCRQLANVDGSTSDVYQATSSLLNVSAAEQACTAALKSNKNDVRSQLTLARVLFLKGDFAGAFKLTSGKVSSDPMAIILRSEIMNSGLGGQQVLRKESFELLKQGWEKTHSPIVAADLAYRYLTGNGTSKDPIQAKSLLDECVKARQLICMTGLGALLLRGEKGVPKNEEAGLELLQEAADVYHFASAQQALMGYASRTGTRRVGEAKIYREAYLLQARTGADSGNIVAMEAVARNDIALDDSKRNELTEKSASLGLPSAMSYLATAYKQGLDGRPVDFSKAKIWAEKAASHGITNPLESLNKLMGS